MQKENKAPISLELCEICGTLKRKGHLSRHQQSKRCITKVESAAKGNRSILEYFKTVSALKTFLLPIAETG